MIRPFVEGNPVDRGTWLVRQEAVATDYAFFVIENPSDDHEKRFLLILSREAWESQGSPERILTTLSAEVKA